MDFSKFDTSEIEKYTQEAKQKWGKTQAWQEFEKKNITPRQAQENADGLMEIFARFGAIRDTSPASQEAQALIAELQGFITSHYYTCTKEILRSLGQMYSAGDSMTENIDAAGGPVRRGLPTQQSQNSANKRLSVCGQWPQTLCFISVPVSAGSALRGAHEK